MRCVRVYIPDDDEYEAQFWGSLQTHSAWSMYERDSLKRGKISAAVWLACLERTRYEYLLYGGCPVNITNVRQNPANPCQLQYSIDNGGSWVTFADVSECISGASIGGANGVTNIRFENNVIVGTDQCGDTVPLGQSSDPTTSARYKPAYPDAPTNGQCLAGANAAEYLEDQIHHWSDVRINIIGVVQQVINIAQGLMLLFPEISWLEVLWEVLDEIAEFTEDHDTDLLTLSLKDTYAAIFPQYYNADGTMNAARFADLLARLETTLPTPPTWTAEQEYHLKLYRMIKAMGAVGMTRLANAAGITDVTCSNIEWSVLFDFTQSPCSFPVLYGQYVQGTGLRTTYHTDAGDSFRQVEISIDHSTYDLTGIELSYFAEQGQNDFGLDNSIYARIWHDSNANDHILAEDDPILEGSHVLKWTKTIETHTLSGITLVVGHGNTTADPGGLGIIQKVRIFGTGSNPFGQ